MNTIKLYTQIKRNFSFINCKNKIILQNYNAIPRPWIKLGSLLALAGYIGQIGCQFLIVSGLWLAQPSPLRAMESEDNLGSESQADSERAALYFQIALSHAEEGRHDLAQHFYEEAKKHGLSDGSNAQTWTISEDTRPNTPKQNNFEFLSNHALEVQTAGCDLVLMSKVYPLALGNDPSPGSFDRIKEEKLALFLRNDSLHAKAYGENVILIPVDKNATGATRDGVEPGVHENLKKYASNEYVENIDALQFAETMGNTLLATHHYNEAFGHATEKDLRILYEFLSLCHYPIPTLIRGSTQTAKDKKIKISKTMVKQESLEITKEKIGPQTIPGWVLEDVEHYGNCFYDAAAHQMKLIKHRFLEDVPEGTLPRDSLRLCIQGEDFKDEEWAEDKTFDKFVTKIDVILAIIDTRNPIYTKDNEACYVYYWYDDNKVITRSPTEKELSLSLPDKPIIKLAATGNHFLSVISEASNEGIANKPQHLDQTLMIDPSPRANIKDQYFHSIDGYIAWLNALVNDYSKTERDTISLALPSIASISAKPSPLSLINSNEGSSTNLPRVYMDSKHPLTHEFWRKRNPSKRLEQIKADIDSLKQEIMDFKKSSIEKGSFYFENLEKYKNILKCQASKDDLALLGCNLHLMLENNMLENLGSEHTPALIKLENGTYDLLISKSDDVKRISTLAGIDLSDLDAFFQEQCTQGKCFLPWNHSIMRYITSKGGHNPLISIHGDQPASFSIKNIKGGSGCDVTILSREGANLIAVKNFSSIDEGLNELLYSLIALDINPSPENLKMAGIYDVVLDSENHLNLIMEGANAHVIHHFLSSEALAENVIKACAQYFSIFHINNYLKINEDIDKWELCPISELPGNDIPLRNKMLKNKIYLKKRTNEIGYQFLGHENQIIQGVLKIKINGKLADNLSTLKPIILEAIKRDSPNIDRGKYISHVARSIKTLKSEPLKEDIHEKPSLNLLTGKQWVGNDIENVKSYNIIRLLSEQEQEKFSTLVNGIYRQFEENCNKIYLSLMSAEGRDQIPYFLTVTHGDAHGNNFFYNNDETLNSPEVSKDSFRRITMIDIGKIARTYGSIADPAEDVGRFLGSLWDWFFLQDYTEVESLACYKRIERLQSQFINFYLKNIKDSCIFSEENQKLFENIFIENCSFYKIRFYRAVFNFTKDKDERKDREIKTRILKSWMEENANLEFHFLNNYQPGISKGESRARVWRPVDGDVIRYLPDRLIGFVESASGESATSYLTKLWKGFNDTRSSKLSTTAIIVGMGGIGKTSLALEYAHEALENKAYNLIYWLLGETESFLLRGYKNLLRDIGVPIKNQDDSQIVELVKQHLSNKGRCLLIYDNVPDPEFLKNKIPLNADIVITSRHNQGWENRPLSLNGFRPKDSVKYLLTTTGLEKNQDNKKAAEKLSKKLAYFPLALSHATHYIKFISGVAVSKETLKKYFKDFTQNSNIYFEEYKDPFKSELEMTYENLVARTYGMSRESISDLARELMIYCSYLHPDVITEDIFSDWWGCDGNKFQEALAQLASLSLIKREQNKALFSLHRLMQFVIRSEQESANSNEQTQKDFSDICHLFNKKFQNNIGSKENIGKLLDYCPHILMLCEHSKRLDIVSQEADSLEWVGRTLYTILLCGMLEKPNIIFSEENATFEFQDKKNNKNLQEVLSSLRFFYRSSAKVDAFPDWLIQLAKKSHPIIQMSLGFMCEKSFFINQDDQQAFEWYILAATGGNASAQCNLGIMYYYGQGIAQNYTEAVNWYTVAAEQGDRIAQFNLGGMYANGRGVDQDDANAIKYYTMAAEQGETRAQLKLGAMYTQEGTLQNDFKAVEWFTRAAKQGDTDAQFNLGLMYENGRGVAQNDAKAVKWFTKSAKQGDTDAQLTLGVMYENGRGAFQQNDAEAIKWYTEAAEQGDEAAIANLKLMAKQGNVGAQLNLGLIYWNGQGVEQNDVEAARWFVMAATQQHPAAQFYLGLMYRDGREVKQDDVEAARWFVMAATQQHPVAQLAQFYLGLMYRDGRGAKQDDAEAARWFVMAAMQGHPAAQFYLGVMYEEGRGADKNKAKKAIKWFIKAAEGGDAKAQHKLGLMYQYGKGVAQSNAKAIKWYIMAAKQGLVMSQLNLGMMYGTLDEFKNNLEAVKWFTLAAKQGNVMAQFNLGMMYEAFQDNASSQGLAGEWGAKAVKWYTRAAELGCARARDNLKGMANQKDNVEAQFNLALMYANGRGVDQNETEAIIWLTMAAKQGHASP